VDCGKKVAGELVVSGGNAAPIFDATEKALDFVAASVDALRALGLCGSILPARNDW
jgi:hypothetical protein